MRSCGMRHFWVLLKNKAVACNPPLELSSCGILAKKHPVHGDADPADSALALASSAGMKSITNSIAALVLRRIRMEILVENIQKNVAVGCFAQRLIFQRSDGVFNTGFADEEQVGDGKATLGHIGWVILGHISLEASP